MDLAAAFARIDARAIGLVMENKKGDGGARCEPRQAIEMTLDLRRQTQPAMYFIGVTTAQSSIMKIFPLWAKTIGCPEVRLEGIDLPLHAAPQLYRHVVAHIKDDPLSLGALVTTHKINLFEAAKDLFDFADAYALLCGEVSSISKSEGRLEGHAKDPITAGTCLNEMLGQGYFARTGGQLLCLGAGGSTTAILAHFLDTKDPGDRPSRIIVVNRSPKRIANLQTMMERLATNIEFEWHVHTDPLRNDAILLGMPTASVIVNATGMGKDLPGSPLTGKARFPARSIVWELNYRGQLDFLRQAEAQPADLNLMIEDGWKYFVHGWSQVMAQVLHFDLKPQLFSQLSDQAARAVGRGVIARTPRV